MRTIRDGVSLLSRFLLPRFEDDEDPAEIAKTGVEDLYLESIDIHQDSPSGASLSSQRKFARWLSEGAANREVNMETGVLRQILRKHRLWHLIEPDFHPLPEPDDMGRALEADEVERLLNAAINSRSRSLFPALMTYFHTGVRGAELRKMQWCQVDLIRRTITVGKSKTRGGEGRVIPLNDEAYDILVEWRSRFVNVQPDHYVFPSERYGFDGEEGRLKGAVAVWNLDPTQPMGSMKTAWTTCRKVAGVKCRLHDARHTVISQLGAAGVPDATIKAIAGWMSRKMLERYSHASRQAKQDAVSKLPRLRPQ